MATLYSDSFTYSNGDIEVVGSPNWDRNGTYNVTSNALVASTNGLSTCITTTSAMANVADCKVTIKHVTTTNFDGGPIARCSDGSASSPNMYAADAFENGASDEIGIFRYVDSPTGVQKGSSGAITITTNSLIALQCSGTGSEVLLSAWYAGTLEVDAASDTDASRITAAAQGGIHNWSNTDTTYDDYLCEDLGAPPAGQPIIPRHICVPFTSNKIPSFTGIH